MPGAVTTLRRGYSRLLDALRELQRRGRPALIEAGRTARHAYVWLLAAVRELGRRVRPALLAARSELVRGYWKTVAAVRVLGRGDPTALGAVAGAAVSFGVCFAVVADATRSSAPATRRSAPHRAAEQPKSDPSAVTLALAPAAKLRVREALLAPIVTVAPRPAPKLPPVPSPGATEPQLAAPQTTAPPDTQAKPVEAKPAPRQRPAAKRRPAPKPAPKHAHGPDFDDTGPKSPPSGGSG